MNLKEQLKELETKLAGMKDRIEANDAEAIAEGEKLQKEIEAKEAEIKQAEKRTSLLSIIGKKKEENDVEEKGTGLRASIKSMNLETLKGNRGSVSTFIKAAAGNEAIGNNQIITYDNKVVHTQINLNVRGLFGQEAISGNALTYYVLGALEGTIGTNIAEGAAKSQIHIPYEPKTVALQKIACYFKETDELLSDAAFLESAIRNRGIYEFNKAVENYLVTTLMATSGVQTGGTAINFDEILKAKQDIMADTGYTPDAMLINPTDWATLLLTKDGGTTGQYLVGGPAYAPYGNGGYTANPRIWGLNVVESAAVPAGKAVIGAFKAGASVVTKANEGFRVEVANTDQDDFIKNRVTVRLEERMVEAVRVPAAFEIIGQ